MVQRALTVAYPGMEIPACYVFYIRDKCFRSPQTLHPADLRLLHTVWLFCIHDFVDRWAPGSVSHTQATIVGSSVCIWTAKWRRLFFKYKTCVFHVQTLVSWHTEAPTNIAMLSWKSTFSKALFETWYPALYPAQNDRYFYWYFQLYFRKNMYVFNKIWLNLGSKVN